MTLRASRVSIAVSASLSVSLLVWQTMPVSVPIIVVSVMSIFVPLSVSLSVLLLVWQMMPVSASQHFFFSFRVLCSSHFTIVHLSVLSSNAKQQKISCLRKPMMITWGSSWWSCEEAHDDHESKPMMITWGSPWWSREEAHDDHVRKPMMIMWGSSWWSCD